MENLQAKVLGYLSKDLDHYGSCVLTKDTGLAQIVQTALSHKPSAVHIRVRKFCRVP